MMRSSRIVVVAAALICAAVSVVAESQTMPSVYATGQGKSFATEQSAVVSALKDASAHSTSEYGGIVYEIGERYYYTDPITLNEDNAVSFKILMVRSAHLVALYHTHTPGQGSDLFSQCDVQVAQTLHVPSYILVMDKWEIRKYTPGVDRVYHMFRVLAPSTDYSGGTLVAKVSFGSDNAL